MRTVALACVAFAACGRDVAPTPGTPEHLAAYLRTIAGADEAARGAV